MTEKLYKFILQSISQTNVLMTSVDRLRPAKVRHIIKYKHRHCYKLYVEISATDRPQLHNVKNAKYKNKQFAVKMDNIHVQSARQQLLTTLRCCVWHRSSPAAAMYVLPIVLIFSTPEYLGFDNSYTQTNQPDMNLDF